MAEFPAGPLTILFSDVEGSTDLRTQRGDTVAHRILRGHEEVVRRCVVEHGGREIKALGDGFMVVFASVRKALECAVTIHQALDDRNRDSPGEELKVRIGVNTGEVVIEGDDLYGQAVNAAARIASRAKGGEILVSEVVRQLAGSGPEFTFVDRGRCRLKGFPDRWHLYGVVYDPAVPAQSRVAFAPTPFVGREAERAELRRLIADVKAGTGAVVIVGGEPGVGKSRLAEELTIRCIRDGFQAFAGHCYERGAPPYVPIVEMFEQALADATSPQAFREFLEEEAPDVARLVPRLRRLFPDLPPPLELPAEHERRYLFNAVWEVLGRAGRMQPTLLVVDDLHFADEPTMLLIQHLAERIPNAPVLMLCLYRDTDLDGGSPLSVALEEVTRRRLARRIRLERLSRDDLADMLAAALGQRPSPGLADSLYTVTEGNPFFTEEVVKHLAEEGRLFGPDGRLAAEVSTEDIDVPEGVRVVIGARLRRLSKDAAAVLGSAAVLGRTFSFELLQVMEQQPEDRLLDLVEEAERARLILAVEDRADQDRFVFAHELVRQTVLSELSVPRRHRLHARAAQALEHVHIDDLARYAAAIAHHLLEAGSAADGKLTFRYLLMAGQWAEETAAFEDALTHLEEAGQRAHEGTPSERAELLFRLGTARRNTGRWDDAMTTWEQAIDAYEGLGDREAAGRVCQEASYSLGWGSRWEEAAAIGQRGLDLLGDEVSTTRARLLAQQGNIMAYAGVDFDRGDALITQALALADQLGSPPWPGTAGMMPNNSSAAPFAKPNSSLTDRKRPTPAAGTPGCSSSATGRATASGPRTSSKPPSATTTGWGCVATACSPLRCSRTDKPDRRVRDVGLLAQGPTVDGGYRRRVSSATVTPRRAADDGSWPGSYGDATPKGLSMNQTHTEEPAAAMAVESPAPRIRVVVNRLPGTPGWRPGVAPTLDVIIEEEDEDPRR